MRLVGLALAWALTEARALPPIVLIFESAKYMNNLIELRNVTDSLDFVLCNAPDYCKSLAQDGKQRVMAVVGEPKDMTLLGHLPRLRLVQSTSYTHPRLADVPVQATVSSYQPNWRDVYGVEPIAEFVIAAVFDWTYRLSAKAAEFASCAWGSDAPMRCPSRQQLTAHPVLMNQTLGVLGYGKIGEAVARRSAALGMKTVATKVHGPFSPPPPPLTWLSDDNDRLLRESDFVVTTLPGSVKGIINHTSLSLMKPDAVLIPTSAPTIDFMALYQALSKPAIGGAVLDVWPHGCWHFPDTECGPPYGASTEPWTRGQFERLDNVVPLPGMAMRDDRFWAGSTEWVAANLHALAHGLPLQGVVRNGTVSPDLAITV